MNVAELRAQLDRLLRDLAMEWYRTPLLAARERMWT